FLPKLNERLFLPKTLSFVFIAAWLLLLQQQPSFKAHNQRTPAATIDVKRNRQIVENFASVTDKGLQQKRAFMAAASLFGTATKVFTHIARVGVVGFGIASSGFGYVRVVNRNIAVHV